VEAENSNFAAARIDARASGTSRPEEEAMRAEIFWIAGVPKCRLAILPRPRGGDWLEDEVRSLRASGVEFLISVLTKDEVAELGLAGEEECCAASGIEFVSFPFADRCVPMSAAAAFGLVRRWKPFWPAGKPWRSIAAKESGVQLW
jgi:hypothetical protein